MLENLQQEKQPQKNDGKRLLYVILVAFAWLLFVFGLMFASSKCSKASDYKVVNMFGSSSYDFNGTDISGVIKVKNSTIYNTYDYYIGSNNSNQGLYKYDSTSNSFVEVGSSITWTNPNNITFYTHSMVCLLDSTACLYYSGTTHVWVDFTNYTIEVINIVNSQAPSSPMNLTSGNVGSTGHHFIYGNGSYLYYIFTGSYSLDNNVKTYRAYMISTNINNQSKYGYLFKLYYDDDLIIHSTYGSYIYHNCSIQLTGNGGTNSISNCQSTSATAVYAGNYFNYGNNVYYVALSNVYKLDLSTFTTSLDTSYTFSLVDDATHGGSYFSVGNLVTYTYRALFLEHYDSNAGGFTQQDVDNAYAEGQLDALNDFSATTNGSGYTYTNYSSTMVDYESNYIYQQGAKEIVNYIASKTEYGATGTVYTNGTWFTDVNIEVQHIYQSGQLNVLNDVSSHTGMGATGTTYNSYSSISLDDELQSIYDYAIDSNNNDIELFLLNYVSNSTNGSGTTYNSFSYVSLDYELSYIYNGGVSFGSSATYDSAYQAGYTTGTNLIIDNPSNYGFYTSIEYDNAVASATSSGYAAGYHAGVNNDNADLPNTITAIASVPLVVLTSMFNFNVLGINIFALVTSIISLLIAIWVIKKILGK